MKWIVYLLLPNMLHSKLPILLHSYFPFTAIAPTTKIQIVNGDHKPLLDLLLQLRELENPITKRTYLSGSPDTWASLISNYFEYSENNISNNKKDCSINWNTIRNYFLDKSGTELMKSQNREKYFHIKESNRLYK
ncbi:hypothetical protein [Sphingobacterium composti Ten et al. 2007 non Yoo et al. 2007]|uniref:hypothetical protein n=1 Tax=Sphingobacterium composti TaxID=363260 RepID=UPI001F3D9BDC|nr:hypothetical protein [Sphingobacterium composti Ten et al. 2007 non Yoo et al. 2007]